MTADTYHAHALGIRLDAPLPEPQPRNTLHDILRRCEQAGYAAVVVPDGGAVSVLSELSALRQENEQQARRIAVLAIALVIAGIVIAFEGLTIAGHAGLWRAID